MGVLNESLPFLGASTRVNDREAAEPTDLESAWIEASKIDPHAFAPLYNRYAIPIYRFCYRKVGDPDVANDLTAQVFTRAIERIDRYQPRPGATFRSWLFAIAHNTIVDQHRRRRFHLSLDRLLHPFGDRPSIEMADPEQLPEEQALGRETDRAVQRALGHLPHRQRRVVELRLAGLTGPEIANTLNMTHPAVKSAQFRAYATMRKVLTELGYAPEFREDDHAAS